MTDESAKDGFPFPSSLTGKLRLQHTSPSSTISSQYLCSWPILTWRFAASLILSSFLDIRPPLLDIARTVSNSCASDYHKKICRNSKYKPSLPIARDSFSYYWGEQRGHYSLTSGCVLGSDTLVSQCFLHPGVWQHKSRKLEEERAWKRGRQRSGETGEKWRHGGGYHLRILISLLSTKDYLLLCVWQDVLCA